MIWVIIFGAIALAGLIMVVLYAVWLAHKAADLMSEVAALADRGAQLANLISQIETSPRSPSVQVGAGAVGYEADLDLDVHGVG